MHGQVSPHFDAVYPAVPLPTTALPTLQGALKSDFGEAVVACDMPEPGKFSFLDSCHERFLWTHKEVDFAPHPVVGLVLQVGDTEKFPHAHGFERLNPFFFQSASRIDGDGGVKILCKPNTIDKLLHTTIFSPREEHVVFDLSQRSDRNR